MPINANELSSGEAAERNMADLNSFIRSLLLGLLVAVFYCLQFEFVYGGIILSLFSYVWTFYSYSLFMISSASFTIANARKLGDGYGGRPPPTPQRNPRRGPGHFI